MEMIDQAAAMGLHGTSSLERMGVIGNAHIQWPLRPPLD